MIHYDKLANQIQFVGRRQGVRCVKLQTAQCPRATRINRMVRGRTVNYISRNIKHGVSTNLAIISRNIVDNSSWYSVEIVMEM